MKLRMYKRRVVTLPYSTPISFTVPPECDTLRIETLTGALTLNILDDNAKDGDYLNVLLLADGTARTVTIGGAQGQADSIAVGISTPVAIRLIYHEGIGKYVAITGT